MRVKKLLSSILAICMILSTMTFTAFAGSIDSDIDTAITLAENTEIANAVTLSETITVLGDVTISGGGSITRAEGMTAPMFIVEAGSTLTLENITIDGGAVWAYEVSEDEPTDVETILGRGTVNNGIQAGAVVIDNSGTVVIGEGAVLQNNDFTVINSNSGATVTISGGTICNNNGSAINAPNANNVVNMTSGEVYGNQSAGGGLTYVKGTSTIDGGELHNNYAGIGGIFRLVSGANVIINGGEFYNNGAENGGVAYVYCWSGTSKLTINGGEFYNNTATNGGVGYTSGKNCYITINDGNIHHNSAYTGGAFKLDDYACFTMNGGTIANNSAETLGGALRQWGSWGTAFNGGVVRDNTAEEGEAIWMGNGLYLSGTEFENNDIYTADYIRVDEDFAPFMLSGAQTADVRGNAPYVLTEEDAKKISVNSLGKFPYFNAETKHVEYVSEHIAIIKGEQQIQVKSLEEALEKVEDGDKIVILADLSDKNITINKDVDIIAGNKARTATTLNNVTFTVEKDSSLSLDGFEIKGLSYIYASEPEKISVTNCDIDITTNKGYNSPPSFIAFNGSNGGSVVLEFINNKLIATSAGETTHGIAGWNSIKSATITGNIFGSAEAPFTAAAFKLMNFVDGAKVEVSNNTFYVNSKDSTWGPNAIQFYQNNSRANNYTVEISANNFYVDGATAAIGVNVNAMGNPTTYTGGATVAVAPDNKVNGEAISISDIIVFGNGMNDEGLTRNYVGLDIKYNADKKIIGGTFSANSLGLEAAIADGYATETDVSGDLHVVEETLLVDEIKVEFVPSSEAEGEKVYNINITADGNVINRLNSVDLTFLFTQVEGENAYEIIASNSEVAVNPVDNSKVRYEFHYNGKTDVTTDTNATITIGQVKFTGYGKFSFAVDANANDTNAAHATKLFDNIVDTFVPGGILADGTEVGDFDISDDTITDIEITVPTRTLTINITFPNAVENNVADYQDMTVTIVGGTVNETIALGTDGEAYNFTRELPYNTAYTVTVSGAGYRTARYTVTMTDDKQLNFWNNVMDEAQIVEIGKDSSVAKVTFLAGDIVKDNNINIYDLSAVVSYFGTTTDVSAYSDYAKYDLNRDGVIDSKDVAYVLVSWNN